MCSSCSLDEILNMNKRCCECKKFKPLSEFNKDKFQFDGYSGKCKECRKIYIKLWRELNRDRYNENWRRSYEKNRQAFIERRNELGNIRRARKYGVTADKNIIIKKLYERDNGICQICKQPCKYEDKSIDHIIPLSKGGSHTWDNVQLAHLSCNVTKGNRI